MIQRLSHVTIYVLDQNAAYDFYVNKLGLEVRTDATMDNGFRWLTVGPKGQPDLEIALMTAEPGPKMDQETSDMLRTLIGKGVLGSGVMQTSDIQNTYEELKAKGVEFSQPPTERFYGVEALFKDNSGNWFSLSQPVASAAKGA
ncbi:Glyoxalase/bleomycin resistance protein/dioxygenase [Candidatus Sulfopaludibacter sp. SbA3]|nr:Glyoxalase/bleomycin resistance protein/dioxygenase [Candidatus Sulfopaludibacter sp. SbA3]